MRKEAVAHLMHIRTQFPRIPADEASVIQQLLQQKQGNLMAVEERRNAVHEELTRYRRHVCRELGESPSPARLCALYLVDTTVENLWRDALNDYNSGQTDRRFCHEADVAYGMSTTLNRIIIAESFIEAGDEMTRRDLGTAERYNVQHFGVSAPVGNSMEMYILAQASARWAAGLYNEDPSGFNLLDAYVEQLRTEPNRPLEFDQIPTGVNQRIVVLAAEWARDLYKAVYPLSEQVTREAA